jgi:hypothetical protein
MKQQKKVEKKESEALLQWALFFFTAAVLPSLFWRLMQSTVLLPSSQGPRGLVMSVGLTQGHHTWL